MTINGSWETGDRSIRKWTVSSSHLEGSQHCVIFHGFHDSEVLCYNICDEIITDNQGKEISDREMVFIILAW